MVRVWVHLSNIDEFMSVCLNRVYTYINYIKYIANEGGGGNHVGDNRSKSFYFIAV